MADNQKQCCVRLPADLHRWAKSYAYSQGITLQEFIRDLLMKEFSTYAQNFINGENNVSIEVS